MKKLSLIGLVCALSLYPIRSEAQIKIDPQPYISSSGTTVGPIKCTADSALAPCYSWSGDSDTGVFNTTANYVGFTANGVNVASVHYDSASVLGIRVRSDAAFSFSTGTNTTSSSDVWLRRSAAKTLTLDTDGAGGALTAVQLFSPLLFGTDNTFDIGANGANRPRNLWLAGSVLAGSSSNFQWASRSVISSPADGLVQLLNGSGTGLTRLILGTNDATTNGSSLNLNSGVLETKTGDATAYISLKSLFFTPSQAISGVANVAANSCGTTTATITGTSTSNVITVGATSGSQCRIAFTTAAPIAWDCVANDDTTTIAVRTTPVDTTHTDVIGAFTAADKVTTHCFPR